MRRRTGWWLPVLKSFGSDVIDLGGIGGSRYLEPMVMVSAIHGFRSGSWNHAFTILKK